MSQLLTAGNLKDCVGAFFGLTIFYYLMGYHLIRLLTNE